jgi:hypothetical protein
MDPQIAARLLLEFYQEYPDYLDVFLNALLVETGIRRSFLIQPIDYKEPIGGPSSEWEAEAPITVSLLRAIHRMFPNFKFVHMNQGVLVLLSDTPIPFDLTKYTNVQLGELLSYPCPGDIANRRNFGIHYRVLFHQKSYHLFAVICGEINPPVDRLAKQIQEVIDSLNPYLHDKLTFKFTIERIISIETVIQAVMDDQITPRIRSEIHNILYNADLAILNILHRAGIIDLYDPTFHELLLYIVFRYQADMKPPNPLRYITNPAERRKVRHAQFEKDQDAIVNILTTLYGIHIDPQYLDEARQTYFKP